MTTRKVWALVEIQADKNGRHFESPKLVGGVDVEAARAALLEAMRYKVGWGPSELFNTKNGMYSPQRSIKDIALDHGKDPNAVLGEVMAPFIERDTKRGDSGRAAEWAREHPEESKGDPKQWYVRQFARTQRRLTDVFERKGAPPDDLDTKRWAEAIGISDNELRYSMHGDDDAPFFSEAYLYTLMGEKDSARSILYHMRQIARALGVDEMQYELNEREAQREADAALKAALGNTPEDRLPMMVAAEIVVAFRKAVDARGLEDAARALLEQWAELEKEEADGTQATPA